MNQMKQKILIVDDEKNVISSMQRALKGEHYEVLTTTNPKDVIEMLYKNQDIELIISDYNMPYMNGVELLTEITNLFPHVKRYILSAYQDFTVIVNALNEGIVHRFFSKPWDIDDLKSKISNALEEIAILKENKKNKNFIKHYQYGKSFDFLEQLDLAINYGQSALAVIVISIKNVQSLYLSCGIRRYQETLDKLLEKIKQFYENKYLIRMLNESTFGIMIQLNEQNNEDIVIAQLTQLYEYLEVPVKIGISDIKVEIHCGMAIYPDHGNSAEYLTRNAQEAMYNAMNNNRKLEVYQPKHLNDINS